MLTSVISKIKQFILKIKENIFKPRNNDVQNLNKPEISTKSKKTQEQDVNSIYKDEEPASSKTIKKESVSLTNNEENSGSNHSSVKSSSSKFEHRKGKIVYPIDNHTFLTRSNLNYCVSHRHNLADIYGRVSVVMEDKTRDVRFPAVYCQTCDKFFVLEHVYKWLQSKGRVLCRIVTNEYWTAKQACINEDRSIDDIYGDPESHLHSLGYNVNSQIGLSKAQRRYILRRIIMNKQMTRAEIESHLSYLIRRNQYNYNFQKAINKWYDDLLFIENLDLSYSRIPMTELRINKYHHH
ncbi:MAG: hypothetical protein HDT49_04135 [Lactobacillus sp.]|nr:hypothetical protein [Lactobacillus sp.]